MGSQLIKPFQGFLLICAECYLAAGGSFPKSASKLVAFDRIYAIANPAVVFVFEFKRYTSTTALHQLNNIELIR